MCLRYPRHAYISLATILGAMTVLAQDTRPSDVPADRSVVKQEGTKSSSIEAFREFALRSAGVVQRGKEVFAMEKLGCMTCHAVEGLERKAGPHLLGIADKYLPAQLVQAVLEPSKEILPDYATTVVATHSGAVHTGILRKRSPQEMQLVDAKGALIRIAAQDIADENKSSISLMPSGIHQLISEQEFADLIAYLQSLKQPLPTELARFSTPDEIISVEEPIRIEPFHDQQVRFEQPVWFHEVPGETDLYVVLEHETARIWLLEKCLDGDRKTLFVDLAEEVATGSYQGLMCLAFHPEFPQNRKYYLKYHIRDQRGFAAVVAERQVSLDSCADAGKASRRIIRIDQGTDIHNGGMIAFGPDGYLYVGTGDGGPQEDPDGHGQDLHLLLAAILRIDVDRCDPGLAYAIPSSNPFCNHPDERVRREIWAPGMREPWRFSFDLPTGDLWVGDVGQARFEEVSIVRAGENHGWNVFEGFAPFSDQYRKAGTPYTSPIVAMVRKHGVSITGGYVYRGRRSPSYDGVYIFGDYQSQRVWGLTQSQRKLLKLRQIGQSPEKIASFGVDSEGELYLVGYEGIVYRLMLEDSVFE